VHPLLALPYAALALTADALARLPVRSELKAWRAIQARRGALERLTAWGRNHRDATRPLLWMHAPSVGEGLQARPVIELLRARHPALQVCYTHYSPSAERFAEAMRAAGSADVVEYLPFDTASNAVVALDALRPTALVFAKLDVWPRLVAEAAARRVQLGLVSATLSAGSGRSGALARAMLGDAYAALDVVGAIDDADRHRLVALGVRADRIRVAGDTRYDQVIARAAAVDRNGAMRQPLLEPLLEPLLAPLRSTRPTLVAGSTWPADEHVLLDAWRRLHRELPEARLIIAPHEPTAAHCAPIRRWASDCGLSLAALGDASLGDASLSEATPTPDPDVLLVDRVGVLGDLYALATAAYVGGGFHAAGLHSVLEPAAFGAPVLFGPRHSMSRDAGLLLEAKAATTARDAAGLADALRILFTEPDTRARAGHAALAVVRRGQGAAERSAALVERLLGLG